MALLNDEITIPITFGFKSEFTTKSVLTLLCQYVHFDGIIVRPSFDFIT